jgi:hypothetical protein
MRSFILVAAAVAGLSLAACTKSDEADIKQGAKSAGAEIKDAAHDIANDPDVKEAGAAVKNAGAKAADAVKDTAAEAQESLADSAARDKSEAEAKKDAGE